MLCRKKTFSTLIALGLISLFAFGCGKSEDKTSNKDSSKIINVAASADTEIGTLDTLSDKGFMQIYPLIYDSLVEYGPGGEIIPGLAESWKVSEDGKSYTFHLRKDVKFSDGTPCDAEAVKFSIERWANNDKLSWMKVCKDIEKVNVIDKNTIKLDFESKYCLTLMEFTYPRPIRVISPTAVEPAGDPKGKFVKPIGTGAWKVEKYEKDKETVLVKNTNYWGEKPKVDKLVIKVIPDAQTRVLALQNGEVDLSGGQMAGVPIESLALMENNKDLKVSKTSGSTSYFLMFNNKSDMFKDVKVRQAINYAINKEEISKDLFDGIGEPAKGLFQLNVPHVTKENNKGYEHNIEKAKELLNEAGWKDSNNDGILDKDGKELTIPLVLQIEEFPEWKSMCEVIQASLLQAGIKVDLKVLEASAYYDCIWKSKDYGLVMYRTYSDGWNPYFLLKDIFHTREDKTVIAYTTEELEKLIDSIAPMSDKEEIQKTYDKIFKLMHEEALCVPIYYTNEIFVTNKTVSGFEFGNTTYNPVIWEKLDKEN